MGARGANGSGSGSQTGTDGLPPLYRRWVDALLAAPIPAETRATCADCAMVSPDAPAGDASHFNARTKCCTLLPDLANYLVGRALLDDDPASAPGRESIRARIRGRTAAVTPMGLGRARSYWVAYRALWDVYDARGSEVFGRADALVCPHYVRESGSCGIWKHRESRCATWFCKHDRGATGERFWVDALRPLLASIDAALARWCARELDPTSDAWARLPALPRDESEGPSEDGDPDYRAAWGAWAGREEEFYAACARKVEPLAWREVLALGGAQVAANAEAARRAYAELVSTDVPDTLRAVARPPRTQRPPAQPPLVQRDGGLVRLATYRDIDPIDVPPAVAAALPRFDGRPTREVMGELAREGVTIDADTVRRLVDFGILA